MPVVVFGLLVVVVDPVVGDDESLELESEEPPPVEPVVVVPVLVVSVLAAPVSPVEVVAPVEPLSVGSVASDVVVVTLIGDLNGLRTSPPRSRSAGTLASRVTSAFCAVSPGAAGVAGATVVVESPWRPSSTGTAASATVRRIATGQSRRSIRSRMMARGKFIS